MDIPKQGDEIMVPAKVVGVYPHAMEEHSMLSLQLRDGQGLQTNIKNVESKAMSGPPETKAVLGPPENKSDEEPKRRGRPPREEQ